MKTWEDAVNDIKAEIAMLETLRSDLIQKMNVAEEVQKEWNSDRDIDYSSGSVDHQMIVDDHIFAMIQDAQKRLADAEQKLAETKTVTSMSAGVSLFEKEVPKWHGIKRVVDPEDPDQARWRKGATHEEDEE